MLLFMLVIAVTNSKKKKKPSSPGVLTGLVLPWIEFFFIQKQKMKQINNYTTLQHGFKINLKTGELKKK